MGLPKALVHAPDGVPLAETAVRALREGGCERVVVVLGAGADRAGEVARAAGADRVVVADDWSDGQSASLRTGLGALAEDRADCACVHLVDLPDVDAAVVSRVLSAAGVAQASSARAALARAAYDGVPGHPVVIGAAHWPGLLAGLAGDQGARGYLAAHEHLLVECGDLATGGDVDTPADLG